MGKYTPLEQYLESRRRFERKIQMGFGKIEEKIQDKLPRSAEIYREWWSNELVGSHVQARAWMNAGWRVDTVDLMGRVVKFVQKG